MIITIEGHSKMGWEHLAANSSVRLY